MITIFAIPKPFVGHTDTIQRNALRSWNEIKPDCEILLFGDDEGVGQAADEINAKWIPGIEKSEYGTPRLDSVFTTASKVATGDILCYVNADNLLYDPVVSTALSAHETFPDGFLCTGRRWDVDVDALIDPKSESFLKYAESTHTIADFPGMDYFIFPRGQFPEFPPFIVGRRGWDNWLIWNARSKEIPVIDTSGAITVIHQNHDYNHIPENKGNRWEDCPESDYNLKIAGGKIIYLWEIDDCTLVYDGVSFSPKPPEFRDFTQSMILASPEILHPFIEPFYRAGHIAKWGYLKLRSRA
jgi:hypothetical protein